MDTTKDFVTKIVRTHLTPGERTGNTENSYFDSDTEYVYFKDSLDRIKRRKARVATVKDPDGPAYVAYGPEKVIGAIVNGEVILAPEKEKKPRIQDKQHLSLYVAPDEALVIAQAAAISGKSMSGWCRQVLVDAARAAVPGKE